jgi:hypothetical protein
MKALEVFNDIMNEYLPFPIVTSERDKFLQRFDILLSNIPGPTIPLYFDGFKINSIVPFMTNYRFNCFFTISSYNKQFRISAAVDKGLSFDLKGFINSFDEELMKLID